MSWWDTTGLTSFATNVVKSAQKKIDKVLDIDEDPNAVPSEGSTVSSKSKTALKKKKPTEDEGEFWDAWLGSPSDKGAKKPDSSKSPKPASPTPKKAGSSWSSWGSTDQGSSVNADNRPSVLPDSSPSQKTTRRLTKERTRRKKETTETKPEPDCVIDSHVETEKITLAVDPSSHTKDLLDVDLLEPEVSLSQQADVKSVPPLLVGDITKVTDINTDSIKADTVSPEAVQEFSELSVSEHTTSKERLEKANISEVTDVETTGQEPEQSWEPESLDDLGISLTVNDMAVLESTQERQEEEQVHVPEESKSTDVSPLEDIDETVEPKQDRVSSLETQDEMIVEFENPANERSPQNEDVPDFDTQSSSAETITLQEPGLEDMHDLQGTVDEDPGSKFLINTDISNIQGVQFSLSEQPLDNSAIVLEKGEADKLAGSNLSVSDRLMDKASSTCSSMEFVSESEIDKASDLKRSKHLSFEDEQLGETTEGNAAKQECDESMAQERSTCESVCDEKCTVSEYDTGAMTESSSSSVVKTMLEEAMEDNVKQEECDSHSHSSSDKSDFVKSEFSDKSVSGHESGDEIDTTTSSDIEIISTPTPNGDRDRPFDLSPLKIALSRASRHGGSSHRRTDSQSSSSTNSKPEQMSPGRDLEFSDDAQEHTLLEISDHFQQSGLRETTASQVEGQNVSTNSNPYETEKLLKPRSYQTKEWAQKMAEMAEVISARETKLVQLSKENNDLLESNSILRNQLKQSEDNHEAEMADLTAVTEEFTQRLGEAERKLQTVLREKDSLKKQLEIAHNEIAKKGDTSGKFQRMLAEKDEQVQDLLKEGEKLSKQQLQSNTIIKKLRSKEKENEQLIQSQKKKLETMTSELEHLKKVCDSKDDMEKKQTDAINQLNNAVQRQEKEISKLKGELEESVETLRGTQTALDTSYKEIAELHRANAAKDSKAQEVAVSAEMQAREELRFTMEREQQRFKQEKEALILQIEDLRISLSRMEKESGRREDMLRQEISDLQQRLQEDEARNQELTQSVTSATRPLLRQIENLQSTYNAQSNSWETVEKNITDRLIEAQNQLAVSVQKERVASEKVLDLQAQVNTLEAQNLRYRQEKSQLTAQNEMLKTKVEMLEDSKNSEKAQVEAVKQGCAQEIGELKRQKLLLENQLEMERTKLETEAKKFILLQDELREKERERPASRNTPSPAQFPRQDSIASLSESVTQLPVFTQEEFLERSLMLAPPSPNGNKMSLYESLRQTGAANLLDNLISQLKQKEGEITQLQSEISSLERTRESMARELVNLSTENDDLKEKIEGLPELETKHKELEQRYNALLQMYGEKVEETEELKLDLQDVKDLYKSQIDHLMKGH